MLTRLNHVFFLVASIVLIDACSDDGGAVAPVQAGVAEELSSSSEEIFIPSFMMSSSSDSSVMTAWDYYYQFQSSSSMMTGPTLEDMSRWAEQWNSSSSEVIEIDPTPLDHLTDSRDGQTYKVVTIGEQTWMAQNLNYEAIHASCYDDDKNKCDIYGKLYTWEAAMEACPSGWHLPSKDEYNALFSAMVGIVSGPEEGTALKSKNGWNDNDNGEDIFGFSAYPAGILNYSGYFEGEGYYAVFWTSTKYAAVDAYAMHMNGDAGAYIGYYYIHDGFSVRCLMD